MADDDSRKVVRAEAEWRALLTPAQYAILRGKGTEAPFSGTYDHASPAGAYLCAACGQPLFTSETKYNSGCGWPAFYQPASPEAVAEVVDHSHGMSRTEVLCSRCDSHLGHVFDDGPAPTGLRYCINSVALKHEGEG